MGESLVLSSHESSAHQSPHITMAELEEVTSQVPPSPRSPGCSLHQEQGGTSQVCFVRLFSLLSLSGRNQTFRREGSGDHLKAHFLIFCSSLSGVLSPNHTSELEPGKGPTIELLSAGTGWGRRKRLMRRDNCWSARVTDHVTLHVALKIEKALWTARAAFLWLRYLPSANKINRRRAIQ